MPVLSEMWASLSEKEKEEWREKANRFSWISTPEQKRKTIQELIASTRENVSLSYFIHEKFIWHVNYCFNSSNISLLSVLKVMECSWMYQPLIGMLCVGVILRRVLSMLRKPMVMLWTTFSSNICAVCRILIVFLHADTVYMYLFIYYM